MASRANTRRLVYFGMTVALLILVYCYAKAWQHGANVAPGARGPLREGAVCAPCRHTIAINLHAAYIAILKCYSTCRLHGHMHTHAYGQMAIGVSQSWHWDGLTV